LSGGKDMHSGDQNDYDCPDEERKKFDMDTLKNDDNDKIMRNF
jgi:hypothetical protein